MLKKLMLAYGLIFTVFVGIYVGEILFGSVNATTNGLFGVGGLTSSGSSVASTFISGNIYGFITVVIAALALEKKEENYFLRIAPCYAFAHLFIFAVVYTGTIEISGFSISGTIVMDIAATIYTYMLLGYFIVIPLTLLFLLNPNNALAGVIKKIGLVLVGGNVISGLWIIIAGKLLSNTPLIYSTSQAMTQSTASSYYWAVIFFIVTLLLEAFVIGLGFIANYGLEAEVMEADEIDYEELMRRADYIAQAKQNALVGNAAKNENGIDRSVSNATGAMNVDNQLGVDSNVGKVSDANKANLKANYIDKGLMSVGPVANTAVVNEQVQQQQVQQSQPVQTQTVQVQQPQQVQAQAQQPVQQQEQPTPPVNQ